MEDGSGRDFRFVSGAPESTKNKCQPSLFVVAYSPDF